ncbi:MAG TPA: WD40 repeat domain-containing protein [Candidatus Acidoferrales bacterium]|nr:WD40 repeat domain-containing protein [Candidatus Acidoferrales bacterium]
MQLRPFPGLRPFGFEDREFFFGREDQIYSLYRLLEHSRFIAVVGSSGSGKSSLVRAGLLPVIEEEGKGEGGRKWRFATMHPGDAPLSALADAVTELAQDSGEDAEIRRERTLFALKRSSFGLTKALDEIPKLAGASILIVVDQFEELFRYAASSMRDRASDALWRDEAANFVQLLLEATRSRSSSVYVLITMRSDFIGDCSQFHGLPEAVSAAQFLVPSLTRDQREDVIRKPIEKVGATIDPTLVEILLNDAGSEIDQLPVLQHCLARLWDRAQPKDPEALDRHLGLKEYRAIGEISGALSQHADEVMASLPGLELAVEQVFRALSEIDKEGRATRRALPYSRLLAETGVSRADLLKVLDRFRADDCSFILPAASSLPVLRPDTRIDVVHEALLRRWERISAEQPHVLDGRMQTGWLAAEAADGRFYRAMLALLETESASGAITLPLDQVEARWRWWKSRPRTEAWAERYGGHLKEVEKLFQDSLAALSAERAREEEAERREREQERRKIEAEEAAKRERLEHQAEVDAMRVESAQRLAHRGRLAAIAMTIIALLAFATAGYALKLRQAAIAASKENQELAGQKTQLAAVAQNAAADAKTQAANAVRAQKSEGVAANHAQIEARRATLEARAAEAAKEQAEDETTIANQQTAQALSERSQVFLQSGRQALLDGDDQDAALLLAAAYTNDPHNPTLQLLLHEALEKSAIPDGSFPAHRELITAMAFNPNKNYTEIATASTDGSTSLWTKSGANLHTFTDQGDMVTALAFDPSGRHLVTVGRDGSAKLRVLGPTGQASDPTIPLRDPKTNLEGHAGRVNSVVFSHDGRRILTSGSDSRVKIWSTANGELLINWIGSKPGVAVNQALFSPDDSYVAASMADGTLAVWDSSTGKTIGSGKTSTASPLVQLAISPNGKTVAAGALDGTVLLFDPTTQQTIEHRDQHGAINAIAFDASGNRVLSASEDGTAIIADASTGEPEQTLPAKPGSPAVLTASFNPAGNGIETTYGDGSLNLWTQEGAPVAVVRGNPENTQGVAAFSPDGDLLATGDNAGIVSLWNSASPLKRAAFTHRGSVETIAFDDTTGRMITGSQDGTAAIWRIAERPVLERVLPHTPGQAWVESAQFSLDGRRIVTAGGTAVKIWDAGASDLPLVTIRSSAPSKRFTDASFLGRSYDVVVSQTWSIAALLSMPENTDLDTLRTGNGWSVWSDSGRELAKEPMVQTSIRELEPTPNGRTVLSISAGGDAAFCPTSGAPSCSSWNGAAEGIQVGDAYALGGVGGNINLVRPDGDRTTVWKSGDARVLAFASSEDGKWLASGGLGGTLGDIWDLGQVKPSRTPPHVALGGGTGTLESATFSPGDARLLLGTASDGTVKLWDRSSGDLLASISIPASRASVAAFTPDGAAVIVGAENGAIFLWPLRGDVPAPRDVAQHLLQADLSGYSDPLVAQAIGVLQDASAK